MDQGGTTLTIENLYFVGTLTSDGEAMTDIELTGRLDTRPFDAMAGFDVCLLAVSFGDECAACNDGAIECLDIWLIADQADWVVGLDIDETYDPALDADCAY
jgi:hypothetical protein